MRNTWNDEVEDHRPESCYPCGGSGSYKLPLGAPGDGREVEDEDNCYCDCHAAAQERESRRLQALALWQRFQRGEISRDVYELLVADLGKEPDDLTRKDAR